MTDRIATPMWLSICAAGLLAAIWVALPFVPKDVTALGDSRAMPSYMALFMVVTSVVGLGALALLQLEVAARRDAVASDDHQDLPLSFFDTMTGIPNRIFFQDKLASVLSTGSDGALFLLDLAQFGKLNDRRGRAFGDAVIKEIASRLRFRADASNGFAARLGGDRFGLYLPPGGTMALDDICTELAEICKAPVAKGGEIVHPAVSIGAVDLADLGHLRALGFETVISVCNFALFAARKDENGFRIYDRTLEEKFVDRDAMAMELPQALRQGDLEVFLQPRVSLKDGALCGFEALVRWSRGGRYVAADELIAMAEETGLIVELDQYMMDRAVQTVADWNRRRKTGFSLSVNLSALHLGTESGTAFILKCLSRHRLATELLTIEITETANLEKWQRFLGLTSLQDAGCSISIDDFGTGYSTLARLRELPADEIKIDRMLVSEITESDEARFIIEAVLLLARNLKMDVVAEGVETEDQARMLSDLGCKTAQGFLFGRPRPALDWLADVTYGNPDEAPAA